MNLKQAIIISVIGGALLAIVIFVVGHWVHS